MKVAVIGSRNFKNLVRVVERMQLLRYVGNPNDKLIISGGAEGVDQHAINVAKALQLATKEIKPDYTKYGDDAPHKRNDEIIEEAHKVIAFWTGEKEHSGTWSVISKCMQRKKDIEIIFDEP